VVLVESIGTMIPHTLLTSGSEFDHGIAAVGGISHH
jgi:hypothetical protein